MGSLNAPIGQELHDPLSQNLFRLLGRTRDYDFLDSSRIQEPRFHLDVPGLAPRSPEILTISNGQDTTRFVEDEPAIVTLLADSQHYRRAHATWFDASRQLDRHALQLVAGGHFSAAASLWIEDEEPTSRHNLAILYYLQLLADPATDEYWHNVLHSWSQLAERSNEPVYAEELTVLCRQLETTALEASRQHRPSVIRRCLTILQSAYSHDEIDRLQERVLGDDYCRLELACAEVRNHLADFFTDALTMETAQNIINERILGVSRILLEASLPGSDFNQRCRHQVSAVLRGAARAWASLGSPQRQLASLESAADMCIGGEQKALKAEIAVLKAQTADHTVGQTSLEIPTRAPRFQVVIGVLIAALVVGGFLLIPNQPLTSPDRMALQQRLNVLHDENTRLVRLLGTMNHDDPRREEYLQQQRELQKELQKLNRALIRR